MTAAAAGPTFARFFCVPRLFACLLTSLLLTTSCASDPESDVEYTAGRYIMPRYGCEYMDVNRRFLAEAFGEVMRHNPYLDLRDFLDPHGKPLGTAILLLK